LSRSVSNSFTIWQTELGLKPEDVERIERPIREAAEERYRREQDAAEVEKQKQTQKEQMPTVAGQQTFIAFSQAYQKAEKSYLKGDYEVAAKAINQLKDNYPRDPSVLLLRGHIYCFGLQQYSEAQIQYQEVLKVTTDPEFIDYANAGFTYAKEKASTTTKNDDLEFEPSDSPDFLDEFDKFDDFSSLPDLPIELIDTDNLLEIDEEEVPRRRQDELNSERFGANYYAKLQELLAAQDWKAADKETARCMCEVMDRQKEGWLRIEDIEQFPCLDLKNIDRLWVTHSNGRFGFSVQKQIWQDCGSPTKYNSDWERFGEAVGWRTKGGFLKKSEWLLHSQLTFALDAPKGHLPSFEWCMGEDVVFVVRSWSLLSRPEL